MTRYRLRWPVVLFTSLLAPGLGGLVIALAVRPVLVGCLLGALLALSFGALNIARVRRRQLTVDLSGLEVHRDKYGLRASWQQVIGAERRWRQGWRVDELVLAGSDVFAHRRRGVEAQLPKGVADHPATRRIQVSAYDKRWRDGPIGAELRRVGRID